MGLNSQSHKFNFRVKKKIFFFNYNLYTFCTCKCTENKVDYFKLISKVQHIHVWLDVTFTDLKLLQHAQNMHGTHWFENEIQYTSRYIMYISIYRAWYV